MNTKALSEIDPRDIRGTVFSGKPIDAVEFILKDGETHRFDGNDLEGALAVAAKGRAPSPRES